MAKLGARLRHLLLKMPGDLGDFTRQFWLRGTSQQRAAAAQTAQDRDVLPFPFAPLSVEELK